MGQTGHLALAFEPADEIKIIALLNDAGDDDDFACVRYQPDFDLTREDNYEVHRVLEVLAENSPDLATLGTIVMGSKLVAQAAMGSQYLHTADAVRMMAEAYQIVSPEALSAAIEKVGPEFGSNYLVYMPSVITAKFAIIRDQLSVVASNGWAMVAGMF